MDPIPQHVSSGTVLGGGGFEDGEVLCAYYDNQGLIDIIYYVAKIMTPATSQTENQTEVVFTRDGKKMWTKYVIPSHKAETSEIELGMLVFRHVWADRNKISADNYREQYWQLKRVISTDELIKGVVEVEGKMSHVKWLRITDQPGE